MPEQEARHSTAEVCNPNRIVWLYNTVQCLQPAIFLTSVKQYLYKAKFIRNNVIAVTSSEALFLDSEN